MTEINYWNAIKFAVLKCEIVLSTYYTWRERGFVPARRIPELYAALKGSVHEMTLEQIMAGPPVPSPDHVPHPATGGEVITGQNPPE